MSKCPFNIVHVEEIEALTHLTVDIQEFAAGLSNDTVWVTFLLNTPKALLENPFEGLGAYGLAEAALRNPSDLTAREAWGDFVSYLSIVRAFKNDPEALRHALNSDNWRLTDLIFRMAETAGLYDQVTGWEGEDDDC